jgi:hypothetical protein
MLLTHNQKLILTPLLMGRGLFLFIFLAFTTTYIFFEYQTYRSVYQATQQEELKALQYKTENTIKKVYELLKLTSARIAASGNDFQRIQRILMSAPRLYTPQELPNIQSLAYYTFSKPFSMVSRFGVFPSATQVSSTTSKESPIDFQDDEIIGKMPIFNENKILQGILEIKISASAFKAFLEPMRMISFTSLVASQAPLSYQKVPVTLYGKSPICAGN